MEYETDSRPRQGQVSMLQSQEMNWQRSTAFELQIGRGMMYAIYSTRLALLNFIHGITSVKRTRKVRHSAFNVFSGYMRQILYLLTNFQVSERLHGGPEFSGNYLIDYIIITS